MNEEYKFYAVKLSVIMIILFIAQASISSFTNALVLNELSWSQPWRFVTAIFIHGGLAHLVLNLFALLLFGSILEKFIGYKKFLIVFFASGIIANLISVNFYNSSLGASGAIFGVIGCLAFIRPMMPVWAFSLPMPLFVAGIIWAIADILGAYGFFTGNPMNNTGNIAHLSGIAIGLILGAIFRSRTSRKTNTKIIIDEQQVRNWERTWMG